MLSRLAKAIGMNKSLVNVDLSNNNIPPVRMGFFAEALKKNYYLRVLKFSEDYEEK